MFKAILMTATAAMMATAVAAPAHALVSLNGGGTNGTFPNGMHPNGMHPNGVHPNGVHPNGKELSTSTGAADFVIDGIKLPARTR